MTPRRRAHAVPVLLVAVCAACTPTATPSTAAPTPPAAGDVVAFSPLSPRRGPLVELMGLERDAGSSTYVEDLVVRFREQQDLIAACMAEQGFEYEPVTLEPEDVTLVDADSPAPGTRAFVEQHGYGVADDTVPPGSYTWDLAPPQWESMSGAARDAFMVALDGTSADGTVVDGVPDADGEPQPDGCSQRAMRGAVDDASAALTEEALDHLDAMPGDGRFAELDGEWSRCMREAGYDQESPTAARAAFVDAWAELLGPTGADLDREESATARELEVRVAAADLECQLEVDYLPRWNRLADAYQDEFVTTHAAELEAWAQARG